MDDERTYLQAIGLIVVTQRASTSYLQRTLGVTYKRAAEMMERAENAGVVTPPNFLGKREVIAKRIHQNAQQQDNTNV